LLQSVKQQFEEPILIFLEMLKIFFPAGLEISSTPTHSEYQTSYNLLKDKHHLSADDKTSILLISRIFSLIKIDCEAIDRQGK